jgi:hypothetical protein
MIIVPLLALGSLTGISAWLQSRRTTEIAGTLTPEREKLHEALLLHQRDPKKLRKMAAKFDEQNLSDKAQQLRNLAAVYELPKEEKDARREIFRKAITSKNRDAVLRVAAQYETDGCIGASAKLRRYAAGLPPQ